MIAVYYCVQTKYNYEVCGKKATVGYYLSLGVDLG